MSVLAARLEPRPGAVEDVVAEHQGDLVVADELLADDEGLRESAGVRLGRVAEADAEVAAVAEQPRETRPGHRAS